MAPLQKRALYGVAFGVLWAIAIIVVFILKGGAGNFDTDVQFRSIIDGLWIGGLIAYLILFETLIRKPGKVDERDKLIMAWAPAIQWRAVIFTLVAWVIALSEVYHEQGQVPVIFLFIIFMSILIVSMIAQCVGILIGYWRMNRNG
ncbi:MAG: hypothetical protein PHY28_03760 [Dehalococcoidales bacterium]|nr:hypothetical protein [Dehalococcoidales bacterium]